MLLQYIVPIRDEANTTTNQNDHQCNLLETEEQNWKFNTSQHLYIIIF